MTDGETRKVGDRGQVTLPKRLREAFDLQGGDEVTVREEEGKIIIEKPTSREELAEGYRNRATQHRELANEMEDVSREADTRLGESPDWEA